jgi:hypothetical protein
MWMEERIGSASTERIDAALGTDFTDTIPRPAARTAR